MSLSVDQITAKLPRKCFLVIKEESNYQIIHYMWTLLYGNTSIITTKLGEVNHGHIRFVMQDTLNMTTFSRTYNAPMVPGGTATFPAQATTSVHLQL